MALLDSAATAPMMDQAMMPEEDEAAIDPSMSDEDFESLVRNEIEDAIEYVDTDVAPIREKATLYYRGALFGDEQEGRSKFVSRDVHDTVNAILPSLMRAFFGPDKVVEFEPQGPEDVEMAEQASDYVDYIVTRDNPGFNIFWDVFKDALIRKQGIIKYFWDRSLVPSSVTYSGLDVMGMLKLMQDLGQQEQTAQLEDVSQDENGFTATIKLLKPVDKVRLESVPNEELIVDRDATSAEVGCFTLIAHRTLKTKSQLRALGYSDDELEDIGADDGELGQNLERQARMPVPMSPMGSSTNNEAQEKYLYVEAYVYVDRDGDGIAELWSVCTAGSNHKVLHSEQADNHNLATFDCDPEPHTFFGDSIAEKTMDIQKTKSGIGRSALDSLVLSLFPRMVVARSGVEIADVLNTELGAIIRADDPSKVVNLVQPNVSGEAFPMLAYMDEVRESRTGMSKVAQGLDPGALQNTTALAAANQFNKSHEHIEIIARHMAEGMRKLFRGVLRLTVENQREARVVNLRNKWTPVDPRNWKTNMDVICNVALGAGTNQDKIGVLAGIMAKQEMQIQVAGPNGPMVGLTEYHNTLKETLALSGFKNSDKYFKQPDPNYQPPPPQPDPKIQVEMLKIQAETARHDADRQADIALRLAEINAKYQTTIEAATIKANMDLLRIGADIAIQKSEAQNRKAKEAVN